MTYDADADVYRGQFGERHASGTWKPNSLFIYDKAGNVTDFIVEMLVSLKRLDSYSKIIKAIRQLLFLNHYHSVRHFLIKQSL